jgi:hypothetical protein
MRYCNYLFKDLSKPGQQADSKWHIYSWCTCYCINFWYHTLVKKFRFKIHIAAQHLQTELLF